MSRLGKTVLAATEEDHLTVFEGRRRGMPPLRPYLRLVLERRSFAVHMARSDLKAKHYDTALGQLWRVLNPLLLAIVYFLVLGVILDSRRGEPHYFAQILSGIFAFQFTSNAANFGARSIISSGGLIMNTAFPRALLPISTIISAVLTYLPMLVVYSAFHLLAGLPVTWALLAIPLLVGIHTLLNLGAAFMLAAITVYFRDIASFLPYALRLCLYLSPVLWTVDDIPDRLRSLLALNPLAPLLIGWQDVLIDGRWPALPVVAGAFGWALVVSVLGIWVFLSREREFAVRI
jgi:teichoic acid transport system permease protein